MVTKQITIINRLGLHARAAAKFITEAGQYSSRVQLARDSNPVNGKSIMEVMMLAAVLYGLAGLVGWQLPGAGSRRMRQGTPKHQDGQGLIPTTSGTTSM